MTLSLSPSEIYYTQDSISYRFHKGMSLESVIDDIVNGKLSVHSLPCIRVVRREDKWWSPDNRRLYVFKKVQRRKPNINQIKVHQVVLPEAEWVKKFTTTNGGTEIRVRYEYINHDDTGSEDDTDDDYYSSDDF